MKKVSIKVAREELKRWFEKSRFKDNKISRFKPEDEEKEEESIEGLILEAICSGAVVIDEEGMISQKLDFPLKKGNEVFLDTLKFKPRLTVGEVNRVSNGVKPGDQRANMIANTSARTGNPKSVLELMDAEDFDTTALIMAYFL